MYKYVKEYKDVDSKKNAFLLISHLDVKEGDYWAICDGRVETDVEIVQGYGDETAGTRIGTSYLDRPRLDIVLRAEKWAKINGISKQNAFFEARRRNILDKI